MSETGLTVDLHEAKDRLEEVSMASHQNIDDALKRYHYVIRPDSLVGTELAKVLPNTDFDKWYEDAKSTQGGMVGSARLNWPLDTSERVSLQYKLLTNIVEGKINLIDFTFTFTYEDNNFDANNAAFVERVLYQFHNDLIRILKPVIEEEKSSSSSDSIDKPDNSSFVDPIRIAELKSIDSLEFDLSRIIQFCNELDAAYRNQSYLAVAALTRAFIDHVPPIFNCKTFAEVANNYHGAKSFKGSMKHLQTSARSIGDAHLHTAIRKKEALPTATQINFSNDVDVLLSEIIRLLK